MAIEVENGNSAAHTNEEEEDMANVAAPAKTSSNEKKHHFSNPLGDTFPLFTRPIQRQRWGDAQIHPVVNWGDLFFDLFYVGAAYNLAYIVVNSPTNEGLLYFFGAFFPVMQMWMDKTFYDSRYFTKDDLYHRIFEVATLCALATAVVHIRPVEILSNPSDNVDMFALALGLLIGNIFAACRLVEVMFLVVGGPEAKANSRRDVGGKAVQIVLYGAATIVAAIEYFGDSDEEAKEDDKTNSTTRFLADGGAEKEADTTDVPIWILLVGSISWIAYYALMYLLCFRDGSHKHLTVPANISFVIHRYGEWIMLMLGESILSLLIVDVIEVDAEYYLTFYAGIVSVVLLQYLHFRSQPHHPDEHALRRSKEQGFAFTFLMGIYSAALVLIGTAYKMLVNEHAFAGDGNDETRLLSAPYRLLAGGDDSGLSTEVRQQRVANIFCGSMATVWLCSDLLLLVHKGGFKDNVGRCRCNESRKWKLVGLCLVAIRVGLIVFIATLRNYVTDPTTLALVGLAGILAQVGLRVFGALTFPTDRVHAKVDTQGLAVPEVDPEERKWPNVTHAVAESSDMYESADLKN